LSENLGYVDNLIITIKFAVVGGGVVEVALVLGAIEMASEEGSN
jgi:hypothetical protein